MGGAPTDKPALVRGLTLLGAVALIVGNMVGTSIYTLPASLAKSVGPLGIVAWIVTAAGYFLVALVYANLGPRWPRTGGPYVFAREAFGEFAGFQTVWAYWFSAVVGNAGIAVGVVAYLSRFLGQDGASPAARFALAQALLWGLTLLNVLGVRQGARVQIALMLVNVVPLLLLSAVELAWFDARNLEPFAPMGWGALPIGAALIVWAYSGIESATVPAEEVATPERTIRRGTLAGYAIGTACFLLAAVAVAGALPNEAIASEEARPIALAAERTLGPAAAGIISWCAVAAGICTLNGWILMAGRIPVSAAQDGILPPALGRVHPRFRTPHVALLAGSAVSSAMLLMLFDRSLLATFDFIVLLSVLTTLLPHLYSAAAQWMLVRRDPERWSARERRRSRVVAPLAFLFVLFTIYGVGPEVAMWGFLVVLAGTPVYVALKTRRAGTG